MSVWTTVHSLWVWFVGAFAGAATLADAVKGFKWTRSIFGHWVSRMFGLSQFKEEIRSQLEQTNTALAENTRIMQLIAKEMKPNGGSSMRDAVNRIDNRVDQIDTRQILQFERVKALSMDISSGVQEFGPDGDLIWCNRTYLRLVNRDQTEVTGYGWINSIHPQDRDAVRHAWLEAVRNEMAYEGEYRVLQPEGEVIHISVRATVMRSGDKVIGYVTSVCPRQ